MTLRHMKIFCTVCQEDFNTTKAAAHLHMTQPAVSLAIKELEAYYGTRLFDRIGRRLQITTAGESMLKYAQRICGAFADMDRQMHNWDSHGLLRVGASITIGSQFLPGYVKAFRAQYPHTEVRVLVAPTEHLEQKILANGLDFALVEGIPHSETIFAQDYMEDALVVIGAANAGGAAEGALSREVFAAKPLLLRETGSGTREVFDQAMAQLGLTADPAWESTSTEALINAAAQGLGLAVVPQRMVQQQIAEGIVTPIVVDGLDLKRTFRVIYHRDKFLPQSARAFIAMCKTRDLAWIKG